MDAYLHLVLDFSPECFGGSGILPCRQSSLSEKSEFERTAICLPYIRSFFCAGIHRRKSSFGGSKPFV